MDWRAVKQEARDIVHVTMGYVCTYTHGATVIPDCIARHHKKSAYIGNDGDEFSPGYFSQIERVIIDLRQVPSPARGATLTFLNGDVLTLMTFVPQGENYVLCEVTNGG